MSPKGKTLAIDFGSSSIGLAVCDENNGVVFGKGRISAKKGLQKACEEINKTINFEGISTVVIGLPLNTENQDTPQTLKIKRFATLLLKKAKNIELKFQDETFTTFEANQKLNAIKIPSEGRKMHEDELAAIIILERYLLTLK